MKTWYYCYLRLTKWVHVHTRHIQIPLTCCLGFTKCNTAVATTCTSWSSCEGMLPPEIWEEYFSEGAKSFFLIFPGKIVHFGIPQTNYSGFKKWQKKGGGVLCSFSYISPLIFPLFPFKFLSWPGSWPPHFHVSPFFLAPPLFSVGQQKFPGEKCRSVPRLLRHWLPGTLHVLAS